MHLLQALQVLGSSLEPLSVHPLDLIGTGRASLKSRSRATTV